MIAITIITVYGVIALLAARQLAWALIEHEGGRITAEDRMIFAILGMLLGLVWPISLLGLAVSRWIWSTKETP